MVECVHRTWMPPGSVKVNISIMPERKKSSNSAFDLPLMALDLVYINLNCFSSGEHKLLSRNQIC